MKLIRIVVLSIAAFSAVALHATVKQVTNVGASASTILTPGTNVKTILIQNNGSGDVRISIDGVNDPTSTTGYKLSAGSFLLLTFSGGSGRPPNIRAILTSGTTTTIDIVTDDTQSS